MTFYQYFNRLYSPTSIAIDYYTGKWDLLDNTVRITNAQMKSATCGNRRDGGGYYCPTAQDKPIGYPNLGQTYYFYPNTRGVYINIDDYHYQFGRIYSKLTRGGTTWEFQFCIVQGGAALYQCINNW